MRATDVKAIETIRMWEAISRLLINKPFRSVAFKLSSTGSPVEALPVDNILSHSYSLTRLQLVQAAKGKLKAE